MPEPLLNPKLNLPWLAANATGKGVEVAVIDSGVDATHPALAGRVSRACFVGKQGGGPVRVKPIKAGQSNDVFGHGTAVAGIILGLAKDARIADVKVLDDYNSCTGDVLIAGLKWALDQNIRLINMSLATSKPLWIPALFELCERAFVQNCIIVAARRNFGDLGCPAMFSSVISVDREDYREGLRIHYRPGDMIQFDARGTDVKVPAPGGREAIETGTSFATPHVCGIVALLLEKFPHLTGPEVKTALKTFSERFEPKRDTGAKGGAVFHSTGLQDSNGHPSILRQMRRLGVPTEMRSKQLKRNP